MQFKCLAILLATLLSLCDAIIVREDDFQSKQEQAATDRRASPLNFHEVDAFGDDFVDFGAQTGPLGAFSWHANFPIEDERENK
ncbi:hypothetical protein ZHAS_00007509 [Anopheles sinensis]|uniref:Uncharacterized protein n=1 Tax=Anopheles sinensis TaxID=74873 RepID=A0A084VQ05_ANOSI|nr:hypothetical protein ZHAS_00007509 [Anopheles sinensis]